MQTGMSTLVQSLKQGSKIVILLFVFSALAFGGLLIQGATQRRQAQGDVVAELYQRDGHGSWNVIDRFQASLNFDISFAEASSGKTVNINHVWNGTSENGCSGTVRWERATDLNWDVQSGKLELITPYVLNVKGRPIRIPISCTTESLSTPIGTISGSRVVVNGSSIGAKIVGLATFKAPADTFQCSAEKRENNPVVNEFALVFRGEGKATASH